MCPGVSFRGEIGGRRAFVTRTALDVWEVVGAFDAFGSAMFMAARADLSLAEVELALACHGRFPSEVDALVALGRRSIGQPGNELPDIPALVVSVT